MNAGIPEVVERVARKFGEHLNTLTAKENQQMNCNLLHITDSFDNIIVSVSGIN